jgi:hypothetical protein
VHRGIDLPRVEGTPVFAVADGVVEHASAQWEQGFSGYGGHIAIAHSDGTRALYAHLSQVMVPRGRRVFAGELIGRVGRTAFTAADHSALLQSGPHLHFEISPRAYPQGSELSRVDPVAWLSGAIAPTIARAFAKVARASSVDLALLRAWSWIESKWNPAAQTDHGAGLFGFTAAQARELGIDPKDPEPATAAAALLLGRALARFGNEAAAIASLLWGDANVTAHPQAREWPAAVEMFANAVLGRYADERKALGVIPLEQARGAIGGHS